jgi:hypothetical protein
MKINLELLTNQANEFGQLLFAEYGEKGQPLPDWAEGLMNLLCNMEHALFASQEITLTKTKEKD